MIVTERFTMNNMVKGALRRKKERFGYGLLGLATYNRTYSRIMPDGRQERWADTVIRCVEGVLSIRKTHYLMNGLTWDEDYWQTISIRMANAIFDIRMLPPGRSLWSQGTEHVYNVGAMSLYNCSFQSVRKLSHDASRIMDRLMLGVGLGFDTHRSELSMIFPKENEREVYVVPDTREGWVESVRKLIASYEEGLPIVEFDYSLIRPLGSPIRGFGGVASGPDPLEELHIDLRRFLEAYAKMEISQTRLIVDTINRIAKCVVAGNVRRSALIALGSPQDTEFLNLKDWRLPENAERMDWKTGWGHTSNNSVVLESADDFDYLPEIASRVGLAGEPGILNLMNVQKYGRMGEKKHDDAIGINPCGEIPLEHAEVCNLSEIFPTRCKTEKEFFEALELATIYSSTVSLLRTNDPETNAVIARNRRIGVSISGIPDWFASVERKSDIVRLLNDGYDVVKQVNVRLAREAGVPPSIRLTTVKPSGCWKADTLLLTEKGFVRFEELVNKNGDKWQDLQEVVPTRYGCKKVLQGYNNGLVPTKKITTSDGLELEISLTHKMLVRRNGTDVWVNAPDLVLGDKLVARIGGYEKTGESSLIPLEVPSDGRTNGLHGPNTMTPDLAWFLGLFWGDGSVHEKGIRISFNRKEAGLVQWIAKFAEEVFGLPITIDNDNSIYLNSVHLLRWLETNGLLKQFAGALRIPYAIRTASTESIKAFIAGVWRADGGTHNETTWTVCTVSKEFAQELLVLGRGVGMNLRVRCAGPGQWGSQDRWIVSSRTFDKGKSRYQERSLKERFDENGYWLDPIIEIGDGFTHTLDVEVEDVHEYVAQGFVSHNTISLLAGVSPGMHHPIFQTYLRGVKVAANSPIAPLLLEAGVPNEPDDKDPANTIFFQFPVHVPKARAQDQVSLSEHGLRLILISRFWTDNAASNTSTFRGTVCRDEYGNPVPFDQDFPKREQLSIGEEGEIEPWLTYVTPHVKSISMLPYYNGLLTHRQMPYESISFDKYTEISEKIKDVDWSTFEGSDGEDSRYCEGEYCEI